MRTDRRRYGRAVVPAAFVLGDGLIVLVLAAWLIQGLACFSGCSAAHIPPLLAIGAIALGIVLIHVAVAVGLWLGRPAARVAGIVLGLVWAVPGLAAAPVTDTDVHWLPWLAVAAGGVTLLACIAPLPPPGDTR